MRNPVKITPIDKGSPYFNIFLIVFSSSSLLSVGLGNDWYIVYMSRTPVAPAISTPIEKPVTAPKVPKPKITNVRIKAVFTMDCTTIIILFRCIFSIPVKAAVAALTNALVKTNREAI